MQFKMWTYAKFSLYQYFLQHKFTKFKGTMFQKSIHKLSKISVEFNRKLMIYQFYLDWINCIIYWLNVLFQKKKKNKDTATTTVTPTLIAMESYLLFFSTYFQLISILLISLLKSTANPKFQLIKIISRSLLVL